MAFTKLYWYNTSTSAWVKVSDSLDAQGSPVDFGLIRSGSSGTPIQMQMRTDTGYQTISTGAQYDLIRITPSGTHSGWVRLAPDSSGSPGTWLAGGTALTAAAGAEVEPANPRTFWATITVPSGTASLTGVTDTKLYLSTYLTNDFTIYSLNPTSGQYPFTLSGDFSITLTKDISSACTGSIASYVSMTSGGSAIAITPTVSTDRRTIVVNPTPTPLGSGATYVITLSKTLRDFENCELSEGSDIAITYTWGIAYPAPTFVGSPPVTLSSITSSGMVVSWTSSGATTAFVGIKQAPESTTWTDYTWSRTSNINTYTLSGLSPFTTYYVRVRLEQAGWTGADGTFSNTTGYTVSAMAGSSITGQTTYVDTVAPNVVTGLAAESSTSSSISLSWGATYDNIGVTKYGFVSGSTSSTPSTGVSDVLTAASSPIVASGLTCGTTYYWWARAYDANNNVSSAWSAVASAAPSVITQIQVGATFDGATIRQGALSQFANLRAAATSDFARTSAQVESVGYYRYSSLHYFSRAFYQFQTSAIPDGATVTSAYLRVNLQYREGSLTSGFGVNIVPVTSAVMSALPTYQLNSTSYDQAYWGGATPTVCGTYAASALPAVTGTFDIPFNSSGLAGINKSGYTWFGVRSIADCTGIDPAASTDTYFNFNFSEVTTSAARPLLIVHFTE